jgi:hypothetical protein
VYGLIPEANKGAIIHAPQPTAPRPTSQPRSAGAYGRRISK